MPAIQQQSSNKRRLPVKNVRMETMLTTRSVALSPQSDSSTTWPMFAVVSTDDHEKISATMISGTTEYDTTLPTELPVVRETSRNITAHCATKHSSARVATERPTTTLDSQESCKTMRGTSYTGMTDRNAHPNT